MKSEDNLRVAPHEETPRQKYLCDNARHLICVPYSIDNLHKMAADLGIKKCWFHKDHYDIPKRRIAEITAKCEVVDSREIVKIVRPKNSAK
jgi:FMN phosphatase YigB (HAD superfamily)